MSRPCVVDASVALKWFFDEDHTAAAEDLAAVGDGLIAPTLVRTEVANGLWKKHRIGAVTLENALEIWTRLPRYFRSLIETGSLMPRALALSFEMDHAIYDCIYLALAEERQCSFVTADLRFRTKLQGTPYARHVIHIADWRPE